MFCGMFLLIFFISALCVSSKAITSGNGNAVKATIETENYIFYDSLNGEPYTVGYDSRSFFINNKRTLLLGGSIHYPRLSPGQWVDILTKAKNDGLNHIEIYVFWNLHEPYYNFTGNHTYYMNGRANLTGFLQTAQNIGLFINLRIGPYVCAEWSFGGLPVWLLHIPNIKFRCSNDEWEEEMSTFVKYIAKIAEPYLAKNGGPIILAQIENEYHYNDMSYINWCGELASSLNFDIPWLMCNGESANNTINTCNGNDCYSSFISSHLNTHANEPLGWTENEGWFQYWQPSNGNNYVSNETGWANRSPQDMAYVIAIWFAAGGSHHNYYMYYGGNHINSMAGSSISSYYADGVNYHSDGLANEPKKSHLNKLHNILIEKQYVLLHDKIQYGNEIYLVNGTKDVFAYVYQCHNCSSNSKSKSKSKIKSVSVNDNYEKLTFLCNINENKAYNVLYNGINYYLPSKSVSILDSDNSELYNSGKVENNNQLPTKRVYKTIYNGTRDLVFESWNEILPIYNNNIQNRSDKYYTNNKPYEQIRFTNNTSEYLYYETEIRTNFNNIDIYNNEISIKFNGQEANAYNVYINGIYLGNNWNGKHSSGNKNYSINLNSTNIMNSINSLDCSKSSNNKCILTILSSNLGIDNYDGVKSCGDANSQDKKGLTGNVYLYNENTNEIIDDYTNGNEWYHWIATTGENLNVSGSGGYDVTWTRPAIRNNSMTWYRTYFRTPELTMFYNNNDEQSGVFLLDIGKNGNGLKRGHWWLNGNDMGHYNNAIESNSLHSMVQQYYYIPIDYLLPFSNNGLNVLIFQEELPLIGNDVNIDNVNLVFSTFVIPQ